MTGAGRAGLVARIAVAGALGLLLAGCAGTPRVSPQAGRPPPRGGRSLPTSAASMSPIPSSRPRPFPIVATSPRSDNPGGPRPFLDVDENGRLGHSSPRGGSLLGGRQLQRSPCAARRLGQFRPGQPRRPGGVFHGNEATLARDVVAGSRRLAVRPVRPQWCADRPAIGGRRAQFKRRAFLEPGAFAEFLDEAERGSPGCTPVRRATIPPHAGHPGGL